MTSAIETPKMVGSRVKRREDPRLITGRGTYVDDIELPRMTFMSVVRSEYAHARLLSVDASAARSMPGVLLVMTADDVTVSTDSAVIDRRHTAAYCGFTNKPTSPAAPFA